MRKRLTNCDALPLSAGLLLCLTASAKEKSDPDVY